MESTELTVSESVTALEVFSKPDGLDQYVEQAREYVNQQAFDVSTAKGRKEIASTARKVSKLKVRLDDLGKDLVRDWKQKAKAVDDSRKSMREQLDALRDEARKPLDEWEEQDRQRVAKHNEMLDYLRNWLSDLPNLCRDDIESLDSYVEIDKALDYEEFQKTADALYISIEIEREKRFAEILRQEEIEREREVARRIAAEQQAERERLAAERAAAEKAERERQQKAEAERAELQRQRQEVEREKAEAAERVRLAEEREAQARADAELAAQRERERIEAEQAEAKRIEAEKKAAAAEERKLKAAEAKRQKELQARRAELITGMEEQVLKYCSSKKAAKQLVAAIDAGEIDHITITFT